MARKKLTDEIIIQTLLTTTSKQECADVLGITPQTISRKFRDKEFVRKYNEAQSDILQHIVRRLSGSTDTALDLLIQSVSDTSIPISLRLQSAKDILRMNREYIEIDDLARRILLLEESIADN